MRKILLGIIISFSFILSYAQFSIQGVSFLGYSQNNLDSVFVVDGLANGTLSYTSSTNSDFVWKSYDLNGNLTSLATDNQVTVSSVPLQNAPSLGYELEVDGQKKYVWVFDYTKFGVQLDSIKIDTNAEDKCNFIQLLPYITAEKMKFERYDQTTIPYEVTRLFDLQYDSTYFSESSYISETVSRAVSQTSQIQVTSPLGNTSYKLSGDQFAKGFGRGQSVETDTLQAFATAINPKVTIQTRTATNEMQKDQSEDTTLSGSAPLEVEILSYPNVPAATDFEWCLSTESDFSTCQLSYIDKDFRYSFKEPETYYLRLRVYNSDATCSSEISYKINVLESSLDVPNVFTPNGDGKNDEFRVAYKSILTFSGAVYDRWGRLVYSWTDPGKGWDGNIGGTKASEGTYFYFIEATGVDKDSNGNNVKYVIKGNGNLLR